MRAVVVVAPGRLEIQELAEPEPLDHQAVVEVDVCGICGTDVHVLDGDYGVVRYPVIPGHEFAGTVVSVGRAVTSASEPLPIPFAGERDRAGGVGLLLAMDAQPHLGRWWMVGAMLYRITVALARKQRRIADERCEPRA